MNKLPPVIIVDIDDELRASFQQALRSNGQEVLTRSTDETGNVEGSVKLSLEHPSDLTFVEPVTNYLIKRVEQAWELPAGSCLDLSIALSESLINAIKHGNLSDSSKLVRITASVSGDEARFTVEDEGPGFDLNKVPYPRDPENLLKSSGRGVLLIKNLVDDAQYNDRGNRISLMKRRPGQPDARDTELIS